MQYCGGGGGGGGEKQGLGPRNDVLTACMIRQSAVFRKGGKKSAVNRPASAAQC